MVWYWTNASKVVSPVRLTAKSIVLDEELFTVIEAFETVTVEESPNAESDRASIKAPNTRAANRGRRFFTHSIQITSAGENTGRLQAS